jgi:hypothetical protein
MPSTPLGRVVGKPDNCAERVAFRAEKVCGRRFSAYRPCLSSSFCQYPVLTSHLATRPIITARSGMEPDCKRAPAACKKPLVQFRHTCLDVRQGNPERKPAEAAGARERKVVQSALFSSPAVCTGYCAVRGRTGGRGECEAEAAVDPGPGDSVLRTGWGVSRYLALRPDPHESEPVWFVTPSPYDSFIRCISPVRCLRTGCWRSDTSPLEGCCIATFGCCGVTIEKA